MNLGTLAKILIVYDMPINIEILLGMLEHDYEMSFVTSGADALDYLARGPLPDLILLDVMMPGMDGYQVCERIKADPVTQDIPVIFVTARTDAASEIRALEAGGVDFIPKPLNVAVVRARVRVILELQRRTRELELRLAELKQAHERLTHLANHDALTDLPNRVLFFDRLDQALALARRHGTRLALLFIDLDKFKPINDNWGHAVGDQLLRLVAERLTGRLRSSDTVGRIGGDEFVALLSEVTDAGHAAQVADDLRCGLAQPYALPGLTVTISASIGIALYPDHGQDAIELARHADDGMYLAKQAGGDGLRLFPGAASSPPGPVLSPPGPALSPLDPA